MNRRAIITFAALLLCGFSQSMEARDDESDAWEPIPSISTRFSIENQTRIVSEVEAARMPPAEIRGLVINDDSAANWPMLANQMTNVAWLRITTTNAILSPSIFASATNFKRLEFLHLQARQAVQIPDSISLLTNLTSLKYLGLDVPKATNISTKVYGLATLRELLFRVGTIALPDGVAQLPSLDRLAIYGNYGEQAAQIRSMPLDLPNSSVRHLEILNVSNLRDILPRLPKQIVGLRAYRCKLNVIPRGWLDCGSLQVLDLGKNEFSTLPIELLALPSLKLVSLDLNNITNVPPLRLADDRQLKITLTANPIRHFAYENEPLVQRGVIEK